MHAPVESVLTCEWRALGELGCCEGEWRLLAERAAEPNVFYEPAFARAAAPAFGADVAAVLVWTAARRLVGFFPMRIERRRYGIPFPLLVGWTHPYAPLGTPLVDRAAILPAVEACLDHLARADDLPAVLLLPLVTSDGPVGAAFERALARRRGRHATLAEHRRALLAPGAARADYLVRAVAKKRRKEFARQRRRLAGDGELSFEVGADASAGAALDDFLRLEANGWKGAAGTAALQTPQVHRFVCQAVTGLAAEGKVRVARLMRHGRCVACAIVLQSGDRAWFWKIAYDEAHAQCSPGVQITLDLTAELLGDNRIACVDSCATPEHAMINHLWRERRTLSHRLIALRPGPSFELARTLEQSRHILIRTAKRVRDRLSGSRPRSRATPSNG